MAQGIAWNKDEVVKLLEPYFKLGMSKRKSCSLIGIPHSTLENWLADDELLRTKITAWQNEVSVEANKIIVRDIIDRKDAITAKWWLERKERDEFATKQSLEHETPIPVTLAEEDRLRANKFVTRKQPQIDYPIEGNPAV